MAKNEPVSQVNDVSRISKGTDIKGNFISQSDIRIDGTFEGDLVTSGKLVLGENSLIKGDVICQNADIWGSIEGNVTVGDSISFKENSTFKGELRTIRIAIEIGAVFNGNCTIINEAEFKNKTAELFKTK